MLEKSFILNEKLLKYTIMFNFKRLNILSKFFILLCLQDILLLKNIGTIDIASSIFNKTHLKACVLFLMIILKVATSYYVFFYHFSNRSCIIMRKTHKKHASILCSNSYDNFYLFLYDFF